MSTDATLLAKLRQLPPERLLHMLAEGDELPEPWYEAIKEIYAERDQVLPEKPTCPIQVETARTRHRGDGAIACVGLLIGLCVSKMLAHTWIGVAIGAGACVFYVARLVRHTSLSDEDRAKEKADEEAAKHGLNELMRCAADGDIKRVQEILEFRASNVNAKSGAGATALIYAARNGHAEVVEELLAGGADPHLTTDKNKTAAVIARQSGHLHIAERLDAIA